MHFGNIQDLHKSIRIDIPRKKCCGLRSEDNEIGAFQTQLSSVVLKKLVDSRETARIPRDSGSRKEIWENKRVRRSSALPSKWVDSGGAAPPERKSGNKHGVETLYKGNPASVANPKMLTVTSLRNDPAVLPRVSRTCTRCFASGNC